VTQALLANMAAFYAVYHGPQGLHDIASRVHGMAVSTAEAIRKGGLTVTSQPFFDTFLVDVEDGQAQLIQRRAAELGVNVRLVDDHTVGVSFGEAITKEDAEKLLHAFGLNPSFLDHVTVPPIPTQHKRTSPYLTHPGEVCAEESGVNWDELCTCGDFGPATLAQLAK